MKWDINKNIIKISEHEFRHEKAKCHADKIKIKYDPNILLEVNPHTMSKNLLIRNMKFNQRKFINAQSEKGVKCINCESIMEYGSIRDDPYPMGFFQCVECGFSCDDDFEVWYDDDGNEIKE